MEAYVINRFGAPEVLERMELPKPSPGSGEVLIRIAATSINPVDYKMRRGDIPPLVPSFPAILHPDGAGVIEEIGAGVTGFSVGDKVWAFATGIAGIWGASAEYMVADARMMSHKPKRLSLVEAGVMPLVVVTAWQALVDRIQIQPGQTVLIHGGTGGVGHIAIQIAKWQGAKVYATCGTDEKCAIARSKGADAAINYNRVSVESYVEELTNGEGFDVVFNTVGSPIANSSVRAAKPYGLILDINGSFPTESGFLTKSLQFKSVFAGQPILTGQRRDEIGRILKQAADLVDQEFLHPLIDEHRFTFEEIAQAHQFAEFERPLGKVSVRHKNTSD